VSGAPASAVEQLDRAILQALEDRVVSNEEYAGIETMAKQIAPTMRLTEETAEDLYRKPRVAGTMAGREAQKAAAYIKTLAGVGDPTMENLREASRPLTP